MRHKNHQNQETQQVLDFKAEHTSILSKEEYYERAPLRLKELANQNEHSLRLAQLEFELQEVSRKVLQYSCSNDYISENFFR